MAESKPFSQVKLICGVIAGDECVFKRAEERLTQLYGNIDLESANFAFDFTDYYAKQMGEDLKKKFLSFKRLISPERLSEIKIETNGLEDEIREEFKASHRIVNLDPGYLTPSALIMATAKNFAHRVPLQHGIYAHLELLFGKNKIRTLDWTYPDYKDESCQSFFLEVRCEYLSQIRKETEG